MLCSIDEKLLMFQDNRLSHLQGPSCVNLAVWFRLAHINRLDFYLLHGREMRLPSEDDLRAKISQTPLDHNQWLKNLKASLRLAYRTVEQANRKSHQKNERLYNCKAKLRKFHTGNLVYLFNPTVKPGLSRKFHKVWSGPFRITAKISDLNYEIVDPNNKKQIVHVNRLKQAYNTDALKPPAKQKAKRKSHNKAPAHTGEEDEEEIKIGSFPLVLPTPQENATDHLTPPDQNPHTSATTPQTLSTQSPWAQGSYVPPFPYC